MLKSQENLRHLGFIVDGNRRWAKERGLPTIEGHRKGLQNVEMVVAEVTKAGVPFVSFYVFSTENWQRSAEEVGYLMKMAAENIVKLAQKMAKNNVRCLILGAEKGVDPKLLQLFREAEAVTKDCTGTTACFCFNYGGQQEIIDAANAAFAAGQPLTPETLSAHLYHPEIPPCDLIVRTSGEERISGFMLWRAAYAEFLFLKQYWPDLAPDDIAAVFQEFKNRQRRFGK